MDHNGVATGIVESCFYLSFTAEYNTCARVCSLSVEWCIKRNLHYCHQGRRIGFNIHEFCTLLCDRQHYNDVIMRVMASKITDACLLNRLFGRRWKKTSKLRVTDLDEGNSPVTGEFSAQRASNAENVSIWLWHHDMHTLHCTDIFLHIHTIPCMI